MQADLRALHEDMLNARRSVDKDREALSARMEKMELQVGQTRASVDVLGRGTRTAGADMGAQLSQVMRAIDELRGTVEVTEHRVGLTEGQLAEGQKAQARALEAQALAAQAREEAKRRTPRKMGDILAEGQHLAESGDAVGARKVWQSLFDRAPRELGSADEALIRMGASLFREKQWDAALGMYVRLLDGFPKSPHVEQAYLQVGLCSLALGRRDDATTFLNEVVKNYPKSERAKTARAKLQELARKGLEPSRTQKPSKK